jgi:hypothetical protein
LVKVKGALQIFSDRAARRATLKRHAAIQLQALPIGGLLIVVGSMLIISPLLFAYRYANDKLPVYAYREEWISLLPHSSEGYNPLWTLAVLAEMFMAAVYLLFSLLDYNVRNIYYIGSMTQDFALWFPTAIDMPRFQSSLCEYRLQRNNHYHMR